MDEEYTEQLAFFYQMASPAFILKSTVQVHFRTSFRHHRPCKFTSLEPKNSTPTLILSVHTPNCSWFVEFQVSLGVATLFFSPFPWPMLNNLKASLAVRLSLELVRSGPGLSGNRSW
jgi:hypothetical protein